MDTQLSSLTQDILIARQRVAGRIRELKQVLELRPDPEYLNHRRESQLADWLEVYHILIKYFSISTSLSAGAQVDCCLVWNSYTGSPTVLTIAIQALARATSQDYQVELNGLLAVLPTVNLAKVYRE